MKYRIIPHTPAIALLAISLLAGTSTAQEFTPKWIESGLHRAKLGYRPMTITFKEGLASSVKNPPADLIAPLYGNLETGPEGSRVSHLVIVDTESNVPKRLFIDAKGDGDFTDDKPSEFKVMEFERPDGVKSATDRANAMVNVTADGKLRGMIEFYATRADITKPSPTPKYISCYTDFGVTGDVQIDGKTIPVMISDDKGSGQFSAESDLRKASLMWVDANANGKPDAKETNTTAGTFEISGKFWKVASMTPEGSFTLAETEKPMAKVVTPSKTDPGKTAPSFNAKLIGGKDLKFPEDYKSKVVLVDFWATWCGPCVAEIPNVVKAYEKYHDRGLEVLGISLDKENLESSITTFTAKKGMPWPQVYDGKFWNAEVATLYGIHAIPHMMLIDGDTGVIIADKTIRGEALAPAIEKALAAKKK